MFQLSLWWCSISLAHPHSYPHVCCWNPPSFGGLAWPGQPLPNNSPGNPRDQAGATVMASWREISCFRCITWMRTQPFFWPYIYIYISILTYNTYFAYIHMLVWIKYMNQHLDYSGVILQPQLFLRCQLVLGSLCTSGGSHSERTPRGRPKQA